MAGISVTALSGYPLGLPISGKAVTERAERGQSAVEPCHKHHSAARIAKRHTWPLHHKLSSLNPKPLNPKS